MDKIIVKVMVLPHGEGLPLPVKATPGASGVDLRAALKTELIIEPGERALIPTGLKVAIPDGFEWQIRSRSGYALSHGISVLNSPGTIDSDYRGEISVILANLGKDPVTIDRGDRIAQAVFSAVVTPVLDQVESLADTGRGKGGFGHSGV